MVVSNFPKRGKIVWSSQNSVTSETIISETEEMMVKPPKVENERKKSSLVKLVVWGGWFLSLLHWRQHMPLHVFENGEQAV
jgi:hypothetical protein